MSAYYIESLSAVQAQELRVQAAAWIDRRTKEPDLKVYPHVVIDRGGLGYARVRLQSHGELEPLEIAVPFTRWFPVEKVACQP